MNGKPNEEGSGDCTTLAPKGMWWARLIINCHGRSVAGVVTRGTALSWGLARGLVSGDSTRVVSTVVELLKSVYFVMKLRSRVCYGWCSCSL